jgi:hypothetical protein
MVRQGSSASLQQSGEAFESMPKKTIGIVSRSILAWHPPVDMEVATHTGKRLAVRGLCEKCDTPTNWVVDTVGRVAVFWCGCGNSQGAPDEK